MLPDMETGIREAMLQEFEEESAGMRRVMERVPADRLLWKPHPKSFTLGRLCEHLAEIPNYAAVIVNGKARKLPAITNKAELLQAAELGIAAGREAIAGSSDAHLNSPMGPDPETARPRTAWLRQRVLSHMIHHRGQLSVYLRLLDVAVPGMYGPSADEKPVSTSTS